MTAKKTTALRAQVVAGKAKTRKRIDWEAVERDHRTGKFTQVELAAKHKVDPATLNRKIKSDRELDITRWQQDLTEAVRQATNASLMADLVKAEVNEGQEQVKTTVLVAAEVNKQIILGHRRQAQEAREAMETARAKLLAMGDSVADIREAATFVSATESLSRTAKIVIEIERTAFGLGESATGDGKNKPAQTAYDVDDDALLAEILADRRARAAAA